MSMFQKATKAQLKARVALDGPSGSGKTFTALTWAKVLGDRTALVDTERGSASLYSDRFNFDTLRIAPPYEPARLIEAFQAAEKDGYEVMIVDSLSHFWEGEGGFLDIADAAGQRAQGNSWAGWKTATPQLRHLIDTMLGSDMHVIVTMRSKTEWTQEEYTDSKGKTRSRPVRIGMAPVMRAGTEYEFTLVGDLDIEHRLSITKSRCEPLSDLVVQPGRAHEAAEQFKAWLASGEPAAPRNVIDSLKDRLNGIEDRDERTAAKKAFVDQFGNPDFLLASKVADAEAFIAGLTYGVGAIAVPEAQPVSGQAAQSVENPGAPSPASNSPTTRRSPAKSPGEKLHRDLGRLGFKEKIEHEELIFNASGGRTVHAAELDTAEMARAYRMAEDVTDGRETWERIVNANDEYRRDHPESVAS